MAARGIDIHGVPYGKKKCFMLAFWILRNAKETILIWFKYLEQKTSDMFENFRTLCQLVITFYL